MQKSIGPFWRVGSLLVLLLPFYLSAQNFSQGTDFWLAVGNNVSGNANIEIKVTADVATTGTISSGQGLNQPFSVAPGSPYQLIVSSAHVITAAQTIENKGIHVTTNSPVNVYAGTVGLGGADAVCVIPTASMGTEFRTVGFQNLNPGTTIIVAAQNNTVVTITPSCSTTTGNPANTPFNVTLHQGQSYQVQGSCDVTGTRIQSSLPIQVFSHTACGQVITGNTTCDVLWATALPVPRWNTTYVTGALAGRNGIDYFRIMAAQNATTVTVNGVVLGTINAGQFLATTLSGGNVISANAPIFVSQFARSNSVSGGMGDPSIIQLFPTAMFGRSYRFPTMVHSYISTHHLTIVARTAGISSVRLDGLPVAGWTTINSGWSYAQSTLVTGEHTLTGDSLLHGVVYGWGGVNSYGTSLGGIVTEVVLPLEGTGLRGTALPEGVLVEWNLPEGLREGSFELQRSQSTQSGERIAEMQVDVNTLGYSFLDTEVAPDESYFYRLKLLKQNGEVEWSEWVSVQTGAAAAWVKAFPNPVRNSLHVQLLGSAAGAVHANVYDELGRLVFSATELQPDANQAIVLDAFCIDRAPGMYVLEVLADGRRFQQKFVKH